MLNEQALETITQDAVILEKFAELAALAGVAFARHAVLEALALMQRKYQVDMATVVAGIAYSPNGRARFLSLLAIASKAARA